MTALSFVFVMVLAVLVTVARVCPIAPLRGLGELYVQVFRNIPGVALLILVAYALPQLRVVLDWRTCVIVTVVLLGSAFGSENFIAASTRSAWARSRQARSIGLTFSQVLRHIVIPQALRTTVLPMTNLLIAVMLTTALGSQVPLSPQELTGVVSYVNTRATGGVLAFLVSALGYVLTAFAISFVGNRLDKRVRIQR